ncbi:MAG: glycosyltransferase [Desulfobacteraceae bacterium]|nr:glycosyltransferase [Desulfobacteraceae bacterium]
MPGRSRRVADLSSKCRSVSVIIPTLNEEQYIPRCIRSISGRRCVGKIIIVDAASKDQTRLIGGGRPGRG